MLLPPLACSASSRSLVARPLARRGTSAAQKKQQAPPLLCRRCSFFTKTMPPNKPTAAGANAAAAAASNGGAAAGAADGGSKKKSQEEHTAADYYFDSYSHFGKRERESWRARNRRFSWFLRCCRFFPLPAAARPRPFDLDLSALPPALTKPPSFLSLSP